MPQDPKEGPKKRRSIFRQFGPYLIFAAIGLWQVYRALANQTQVGLQRFNDPKPLLALGIIALWVALCFAFYRFRKRRDGKRKTDEPYESVSDPFSNPLIHPDSALGKSGDDTPPEKEN